MTIANKITLIRIFLSILAFFSILQKKFWFEVIALFLLMIAMISDFIDGTIAKKTNTTTRFGAIADPFADKILVLSCFTAFAYIKELNIPLWTIFIIILRELFVSTLRVLAAMQNYILKAEAAGKFKTFIQFVSIYIILIIFTLRTIPNPSEKIIEIINKTSSLPYWLSIITSIITAISGIIYIINYRKIIKESWGEKGNNK